MRHFMRAQARKDKKRVDEPSCGVNVDGGVRKCSFLLYIQLRFLPSRSHCYNESNRRTHACASFSCFPSAHLGLKDPMQCILPCPSRVCTCTHTTLLPLLALPTTHGHAIIKTLGSPPACLQVGEEDAAHAAVRRVACICHSVHNNGAGGLSM